LARESFLHVGANAVSSVILKAVYGAFAFRTGKARIKRDFFPNLGGNTDIIRPELHLVQGFFIWYEMRRL
jgi:hypothetical protein